MLTIKSNDIGAKRDVICGVCGLSVEWNNDDRSRAITIKPCSHCLQGREEAVVKATFEDREKAQALHDQTVKQSWREGYRQGFKDGVKS